MGWHGNDLACKGEGLADVIEDFWRLSAFDRGRQQGSLERDGKLSSLYIRDFRESDVIVMLGKETIDFRCDPTASLQRVGTNHLLVIDS